MLFFLIYGLAGYRKKVVLQNIKNSFPNKSSQEHQQIAKDFYRHFCDLVVESVKGFSIKESTLRKRMVFTNPEILESYFNNGKDIIVVGGHYNNWEWCGFAMPMYIKHKAIGIYAPLSNSFFDKKMKESREKYGLTLAPMKKTRKFMEEKSERAKATFFIIDQSPSNVRKCHWMDFLNQDTPVFYGAERYSKLYNLPVFFMGIDKIKRGHYTFTAKLLFDKPQEQEPNYITEINNKEVEKQVIADPQYWLWTHRRWKRKRPTSNEV